MQTLFGPLEWGPKVEDVSYAYLYIEFPLKDYAVLGILFCLCNTLFFACLENYGHF